MALLVQSRVKMYLIDYKSKTSTIEFETQGNLGTANMAMALTQLSDLRNAIAGISGGVITRQELAPYVTRYAGTVPNNGNIQRERQWVVIYRDTTNFQEGQVTFPCARVSDQINEALVDTNGFAILSHPIWSGFKTEFEKICRSDDQNNVTLERAYLQDVNI
jgi:hypothetical protein